MANLRNHQLKVWNAFTKGEQNIPADHLIEDRAFTFAHNVNISDSTIRPLRGDKAVQSINLSPNTKTVIKENVKGVDTSLQFDKNISFVNYADTIYYIELPKSKLKQVFDNTTRGDALPTISGNLFSSGGVSVLSATNALTADIQLNYDILSTTIKNIKTTTDPDWQRGLTLLWDNLAPIMNLTLIPTDATVDEVNTALQELTTKRQVLVDNIANQVAILDTDLQTHLNSVYGGSNPPDLGVTTGYFYHDDYSNDNRVKFARHISEAIAELNKFDTYSWTKYAMIKVAKQGITNSQLLDTNPVNQAYLEWIPLRNCIDDLKVAFNAISNDVAGATTDQQYLDAFNQHISVNEDGTGNGEAYLPHALVSFWQDFANGTNSSIKTDNTNSSFVFTKTKDAFKAFQAFLDNNQYSTNIIGHTADYLYVAYDDKSKAFTNAIRKDGVFVEEGQLVTFTIPSNSYAHSYLYRKQANKTEYMQVGEFINNTLTINPATVEDGEVLEDVYRIATPNDDYVAIAEHKGTIFLVRENSQEVWFTDTGNPHNITATSYIKMPQQVKNIKSAGAGVFVWTTNNTLYLLTGDSRDPSGANTLSIKLIAEDTDSIGFGSAVSVDNLVIWLSNYAFHNSSGYGSAVSTRAYWKPPTFAGDSPVISSIVHQNKAYYLVDTIDGRKLIEYDYRLNSIFQHSGSFYKNLAIIDGNLTAITENGTLVEIGKGSDLKPYSVGLKRYAGYSFDVRQRFTNVSIYHTAKPYKDIDYDKNARTTVLIFVDDWLAGEEELQGSQATRIDLPQLNNTGYSIRLEFEGTLGIKSARLRYTTHDWED